MTPLDDPLQVAHEPDPVPEALPHFSALGQGVGGTIVIDGSGVVYVAQLSGVLAPGTERTERPLGALVRVGVHPDTLVELRGRELFSNEIGMGTVIGGATTVVGPAPQGVWIGDTAGPRIELWSQPDGPLAIVHWIDDSDRVDGGASPGTGPPGGSLHRQGCDSPSWPTGT